MWWNRVGVSSGKEAVKVVMSQWTKRIHKFYRFEYHFSRAMK